MSKRIVALLLGLSLLGNAVLLTLLLRERTTVPVVAAPAAVVSPTNAPVVTEPTARPTRRRPSVSVVVPTAAPVLPTATALPTVTAEPTPAGDATATEAPPTDAAPTEPPAPTETATPSPMPSPTLEAVGTDWLQYVNLFRTAAGLPRLVENTTWSLEANAHSRYMTYTGSLSHNEDAADAQYSRAGQAAGENGNIAAGFIGSDPFRWAFNYWISAPFHAIPILDPQLAATGFAEYRDAGGVQPVTATLDVRRGLGPLAEGVSYPVLFPGDGARTWVLRYSLPEFPEALSTCPGYQQPTGAPIILQLGDGSLTPRVTATSLFRDGDYLAHCWFDETTFTHPNEFRQASARLILDQRDAIVVIPQQPLLPDSTYSVRIDTNGATYTWSFHTAAGP